MTNNAVAPLSQEIVQGLLQEIAPGSKLTGFNLLPGSFSNSSHIVEARSRDGSELKVVIRRYAVYGNYDRGEKARREYGVFEYLHHSRVPGAEPLYLDDTGALLGTPGIVTRFVSGSLRLEAPADPLNWARELALILAKIHSVVCDEPIRAVLLDGNAEATWFLGSDTAPGYLRDYPGGAELWQTLHDLSPQLRVAPSGLVHIDYWSGNVLWQGDRISAVLDWEEATYGDPAIDVGYARMNMALLGLDQAADEFLKIYESEMGRKTENLGFWELAAAVRPMVDPADWKVSDTVGLDAGRLQQFICEARNRAAVLS